MKLPDHATFLSIVAFTRPTTRFTQRLASLTVCLPLLVALAALALSLDRLIQRWLPERNPTSRATSRSLSHDQALALARAKSYCARLTDTSCDIDPAEVTLFSTHLPGQERRLREWNVEGRVGVSHCSLRLDADTKVLRVFTRESAVISGETSRAVPPASSAEGDIGALSEREGEWYVRHYLARAGIVLPRGARLVRVVVSIRCFGYDIAFGDVRLLQVSIDPAGGWLLLLNNQTSRRIAHDAAGASTPQ